MLLTSTPEGGQRGPEVAGTDSDTGTLGGALKKKKPNKPVNLLYNTEAAHELRLTRTHRTVGD